MPILQYMCESCFLHADVYPLSTYIYLMQPISIIFILLWNAIIKVNMIQNLKCFFQGEIDNPMNQREIDLKLLREYVLT